MTLVFLMSMARSPSRKTKMKTENPKAREIQISDHKNYPSKQFLKRILSCTSKKCKRKYQPILMFLYQSPNNKLPKSLHLKSKISKRHKLFRRKKPLRSSPNTLKCPRLKGNFLRRTLTYESFQRNKNKDQILKPMTS